VPAGRTQGRSTTRTTHLTTRKYSLKISRMSASRGLRFAAAASSGRSCTAGSSRCGVAIIFCLHSQAGRALGALGGKRGRTAWGLPALPGVPVAGPGVGCKCRDGQGRDIYENVRGGTEGAPLSVMHAPEEGRSGSRSSPSPACMCSHAARASVGERLGELVAVQHGARGVCAAQQSSTRPREIEQARISPSPVPQHSSSTAPRKPSSPGPR